MCVNYDGLLDEDVDPKEAKKGMRPGCNGRHSFSKMTRSEVLKEIPDAKNVPYWKCGYCGKIKIST